MLGGDRAQQADLRFAERVFALVILHHDGAQHAVAADDRNETLDLLASVPANTVMPSASASARVLNTSVSRPRHRARNGAVAG